MSADASDARRSVDRRRVGMGLLAGLDVLLLAVLVLGLALHRGDRRDLEPLVRIADRDVTAVVVATRQSTRLERHGDGWEIVTSDRRFPARADRVDPLLAELAAAKITRRVTDDASLAQSFGLGDDARIVTIETVGGKHELRFGSATPAGLYVQVGATGSIWLTDASIDFYLTQPPSFWAYLRLFPESVRGGDIVRIRVDRPGGSFDLVRSAGDAAAGAAWTITSGGAPMAADAQVVSGLVRQCADLVGNGFYDAPNASDLDAYATVRFDLADGRSFRVEIRRSGDLAVAIPAGPAIPGEEYGGIMYTMAQATLGRLLVDPAILNAK